VSGIKNKNEFEKYVSPKSEETRFHESVAKIGGGITPWCVKKKKDFSLGQTRRQNM
jgi:hypothetical protein